jgi:predicted nucleic acid-binding protein
MTIFLDTGIFVAGRNKADTHHAMAVDVLEKALKGTFGAFFTSDYIFDEVIILTSVRTKNKRLVRDIGEYILGFPGLRFLFTGEEIFHKAWRVHEKYDDKLLSFTDCTIIAWCDVLGIESIGTVDSHFDGILTRIT